MAILNYYICYKRIVNKYINSSYYIILFINIIEERIKVEGFLVKKVIGKK